MMDETVETLGRCCFSSKESARERPRQRFIEDAFIGGPSMSVDRFTDDNEQALGEIHDAEALCREPYGTRRFYGWYTFAAILVSRIGWTIHPEPTATNEWHTIVTVSEAESEDIFQQRCSDLAAWATWCSRS